MNEMIHFESDFMMSFISSRLKTIKQSPTLVLLQKAEELKKAGRDIINLCAGEPDFPTPPWIGDAAKKAIDQNQTRYTAISGTPLLRQAIIDKFKRENGLSYDLTQVIVTTGGKQALFNAFMATLNPGDEVIIPSPYWVSYSEIVRIFDAVPVIVSCLESNNFKLTPELLEENITPKTKWLILNSPNNPTGAVYLEDELSSLATVLLKHPQIYVLSDDIYEHLIFDDKKFHSILSAAPAFYERTLCVNGVSKSYSMTGWRIGYAAGPKDLLKAMTTIQSQSTTCACSIAQAAAVEALNGPQNFIKEWKQTFQKRRDLIYNKLNTIKGLSCQKPEGAFYFFVACKGLLGRHTPQGTVLKTDSDVAAYLLEHVGVAVVPGEAFGLSPYFRISFALDEESLSKACDRLEQAVVDLKD
jgi:aspartate aminotransferase